MREDTKKAVEETPRNIGKITMRMELKKRPQDKDVRGWDLSADSMVEMVTKGRETTVAAGQRWPQDVAKWEKRA